MESTSSLFLSHSKDPLHRISLMSPLVYPRKRGVNYDAFSLLHSFSYLFLPHVYLTSTVPVSSSTYLLGCILMSLPINSPRDSLVWMARKVNLEHRVKKVSLLKPIHLVISENNTSLISFSINVFQVQLDLLAKLVSLVL